VAAVRGQRNRQLIHEVKVQGPFGGMNETQSMVNKWIKEGRLKAF
jgi:hypothetical protein